MPHRFLLTLSLFIWILTGCTTLPYIATSTPTPSPTFTPTRTLQPTGTPFPSITPTPVFASYPWKRVWFKYTVESEPEMANQFGLTEEPRLVIYTDGQVIAARDGDSKVRTKMLNTREVCTFLDRLDLYGFNELEDSRSTEETNPIYDFGTKYQQVDEGRFDTLTVSWLHPQSVSFFEPYRKYLARPLRKIMEYVEAYNPGGYVTYQPDRLIVFVQAGRDTNVEKTVKARAWDVKAPLLSELVQVPYTFLDGEQAANVYALWAKYKTSIYVENGSEYTIRIRLLFPHEIVNMGSAPVATPTESLFPVNCNP